MSDTTTPSSPIQSKEKFTLSSCPPIFVLPTHLTLDALHEVEEKLVKWGARLTYDVFEATLILGKISQKKRAMLELRSRGLWTEEASEPSSQPAAKRRRIQEGEEQIDLSTEDESEEDGGRGRRAPAAHLKPSAAFLSTRVEERESSLDTMSQEDLIRVVRLEWLDRCIEAQEILLPLDLFVVYCARKIERPDTKTSTTSPNSKGILERAKQDAAFIAPLSPFARHRPHHGGPSASEHSPTLCPQTSSENEEATAPLPDAPDWVHNHVLYACLRSSPLHPPNEDFIEELIKIRTIRELNLDAIGVRAYSTAIASIAAYPHKLHTASQVLALPGCDHKIANLFNEFQHLPKGSPLSAAAPLTRDPDLRTLHAFSDVWGIGPKTARDFYYSRHWHDLDDIIEYGWSSLSRAQQIGLKYSEEFLLPIPRREAEQIANVIHKHANRVRPAAAAAAETGNPEGGVQCILVGSYRRGKPESHDVDLILTHRDEAVTKNLIVDVVRSLEASEWITHTLSVHLTTSSRSQQTLPYRGELATDSPHFDTLDKALVVWQDPHFCPSPSPSPSPETEKDNQKHKKKDQKKKKKNPNPHRRVDIIISPWHTIGCAVLGWTGDTTFQRDLRRYVKKTSGWKFDSSGVRERTTGGQVLDLESSGGTWQERERLVMEGLGIGWRDPGARCTR
ncbi:hypothetical protein AOCH_007749 [Aspergillus ochraceoroseus]|uniref:BRCT domain-containing protein n=1 Tax=Aspergillus ochraceoroseus TaxID=138278 RepID=A0A0F8W9I8_9EURO|nr:hypothetical protein AOCH_007749 [Aspergillus ochraceoroseus]